MNALVPRATVEEMVAHRDRSIELYRVAFGKIAEADVAMKAACDAKAPFRPDVSIGYVDSRHEAVAAFESAVKLPDAETFMKVAERITDISFWTWVVEKGDLQRLMDATAKAQLREQLSYQPPKPKRWGEVVTEDEAAKSFPPVTVENVLATIQSFAGQADEIFRRGVATVFSKLDRRFRSHDGFKIGSRVILSRLVDIYGWRSSHQVENLQDIERAFAVLDDKPGGQFRDAEFAIREALRNWRMGNPCQFEVETAYFRIRGYKNGNAHLWMTRDDLVEKVNKLLAEYYGEVLGDAQAKDDPLQRKSSPLAKRDFDLFPSPVDVVERVVEAAGLWRREGEPPLRVLEPSAGTGSIAAAALMKGCLVDCAEIEPERARRLQHLPLVGSVYGGDFLTATPQLMGLYDRVLMNPPFTGERDIDHVVHALEFLKPGGKLVAIMSAGTEFRETRKSAAFRDMMQRMGAKWSDLPAGSFSGVGTNVNTIMLCVSKAEA